MAISTTDVNIILERLEGLTDHQRRTNSVAIPVTEVSPIDFLSSNDLLGSLPAKELKYFVGLGECRQIPAGTELFKAGEPCANIFAIKSGIVEILRSTKTAEGPAALLGVGEVVGLLGALSGGKHRSSGHLPEGGEVLVIEGSRFAEELERMPYVSAALVRMLAQRLMGVVKNADMTPSSKRQLEGSLSHFDLAAVLQNLLANESAAGTLTILDENGDALADILLGCGRIVACRFGDLTELVAFQQLFLVDHRQHRFFYMESAEAGRAAECCSIGLGGLTGLGLLMDCARIVDENRRLESGVLGNPETRLRRVVGQATWNDRPTQALFRRLARRMNRDCSVAELLAEEAEGRFRVLTVLNRMIAEGLVAVVD